MTTADTETLTALQELLEERQRYEGWMRALDQRRAATPAHVYNRVHTDYSLRLDRVLHRLSERTEQLRSTLDGMTSRLNALRSREADRVDARQEAELRATVGEYSEAEWLRIQGEADREIEAISSERRGLETELEEMQRIVELTSTSHQPDQESVATTATESYAMGGTSPQSSTDGSHVKGATGSPAASQPAAADAAIEGEEPPSIAKFVADWPVPHVEPSEVQVVAQVTQVMAEVAVRRDGVSAIQEIDAVQSTASKTEEYFGVKPVEPAAEPKNEGDSRHEQEKLLECPECGTMNYATEWYCERCGGELATF